MTGYLVCSVDYISYPDEADPVRIYRRKFDRYDAAMAQFNKLCDEYQRTDLGRWISVTHDDGTVIEEITSPPCDD